MAISAYDPRTYVKRLKTDIDFEEFFDAVARSDNRVLLLDYDGTIAPFREERDEAVPYPGVVPILEAIAGGPRSRLVIISGRSIDDISPLLGMKEMPEIWGSHGWERRTSDGAYKPPMLDDLAMGGLQEARAWGAMANLGKRFEIKPASVAIHTRGLDPGEKDDLLKRGREGLDPVAKRSGLELHEFDGGMELRPTGQDKGFAVGTILEEAGENAVCAYLGDDLTDEDAFKALKGKGLGVLVREEPRPTAADVWIKPPDELIAFLRRWNESIGG